MKRVHAAAQKLHNTMLSLDNHIHLWQECPEKNVATNLISLTPLPRLALAPFHNEVMKQQVWTARSAWVDKPPRSAAIQWARAARIKCRSQKQPSYTVVTFRDSCLQPLNACLWKWQTTPRLQKTSKRGNPRAQPSYYKCGNRAISPVGREITVHAQNTPPVALHQKPQMWMTCFIHGSWVCTKD